MISEQNYSSRQNRSIDQDGKTSQYLGIENFLAIDTPNKLGQLDLSLGFREVRNISRMFEARTANLLEKLRDPSTAASQRLALITPTVSARKWKSATILFSERIMNQLHPKNRGELSPFAARNRERSIFQGMEVLLSYRDDSLLDIPVYCPVLYSSGHNLDEFPDFADHVDPAFPGNTPVLEVINYIGLLNPTQRNQKWVKDLVRMTSVLAIADNKRNYGGLSVIH